MAFRFSLAAVLRFRESVEKREELALQKILAEMARVRRDIEQLDAAIVASGKVRDEAMQNPVPAMHIQDILNDIERSKERKNKLLESLFALDKQRALQTQKYQTANRDRQMLTDMQGKQRDTYEQARNRADQKFLDDIFAARAQRH